MRKKSRKSCQGSHSKNIVLQTTTLLQGLLKQGFPAKPDQLLQLQISDLRIRDIYDDVTSGTSDGFVLVHKILYKKILKLSGHKLSSIRITA